MDEKDPNFKLAVQQGFAQAAFPRELGIAFVDCGPGWCESSLQLEPRHLQQDRYVHAGVQATMADHTAGAAAATVLPAAGTVLTVEFKINLLRPGQGESLTCRAQVLKAGRNLSVVESEVYANSQNERALVSKATVTIANVLY